jgi:hypothetical protein
MTDATNPGLVDQLLSFQERRAELWKKPISATTIREGAILESEIARVQDEIRKAGPEQFRAQVLARIAARQGAAAT